MLLKSIASLQKRIPIVYTILIIVLIPLTLVFNTLWGLYQFERDMQFAVREQALQIALTTSALASVHDWQSPTFMESLLALQSELSDLVSITLLIKDGDAYQSVAATNNLFSQSDSTNPLNTLATTQNTPLFSKHFEPNLNQEVWVLIAPIELSNTSAALLNIKTTADRVDTLIARTIQDSMIILVVSIIIVILLIINHLRFFEESLAASKLREIDQMKDDFISVASHELRTPLVAIQGHLSLMKKDLVANNPASLGRRVGIIEASTERLHALLEDILNISRIEQETLDFDLSAVSPQEIIRDILAQFQIITEQKNVQLQLLDSEALLVRANADRLREVLTNLISNAVKYTKQGQITIKIDREGKKVSIIVQDTGIGIDPEDKAKLFQKFSRIRTSENEDVSGTGLGLWITKSLTEKMGGSIYVDSIVGSGTAFTVVFPIAEPARK